MCFPNYDLRFTVFHFQNGQSVRGPGFGSNLACEEEHQRTPPSPNHPQFFHESKMDDDDDDPTYSGTSTGTVLPKFTLKFYWYFGTVGLTRFRLIYRSKE